MKQEQPWCRAPAVNALVSLMVVVAMTIVTVGLTGCSGPRGPQRPRPRPETERPAPRAVPLKALAAQAARGKDRDARRAAVRGLAKLGTQAAAEAMIEAVDGASLWLRPTVADGLLTMPPKVLAGLEVAIVVLVAELEPRQKARFMRLVKGLAAVGEPALVVLLRAMPGLTTSSRKGAPAPAPRATVAQSRQQQAAKEALVLLGTPIVPTLLRFATDGIQGLNRFALTTALTEVLGSMGPPVLPHLIVHFNKEGHLGPLVRYVVKRLGASAAPALVKLLGEHGQLAKHRKRIVTLLGRLKEPQARQAVLAALKDPQRDVAVAATRSLAKAPSEKEYVALAQRIKSGPSWQRLAIVEGASRGTDKRSLRLIRLVLIQGKEKEAIAAARVLGNRGDKGAVTALRQILKRRSVKLRATAIRALGAIRAPKTLALLARLARRGKKGLRLAAIAALGRLGTQPARKLLKRLKKSRNKAIAKAASEALAPSGLAAFGGSLGIPQCDAYLKLMLCYLKQMPVSTQNAVRKAIQKGMAAWRKMTTGPARASVGQTCLMARQRLEKSMQQSPKYSKCLSP